MSDFDRRVGLGASEGSAILGLSPFSTPTDVWLSKMSDEPVTLGTGDMTGPQEWGHRLEPAILEKYNEEMGWAGAVPPAETRMHPDGLPIFATPDGLPANGCVDAKCTNFDEDWGEEGTDQVPDHYMVQGVIQMAVFNRPWVDFAVLFLSRRRFGIWRVDRDKALEEIVLGTLASWWGMHVETRQAPDPMDLTYLKSLKPNGTVLEALDIYGELALNDLRFAEKEMRAAQVRHDTAKLEIKRHIGENDGVEAKGLGRVTWKENKKGSRVFRATWED
jgi:hypothetical protein